MTPEGHPTVHQMSVQDLKGLLGCGPVELLDVRTQTEWDFALIEGARLLNPEGVEYLAGLAKDTRLVFYCHHGIRSQSAALHFLAQGYSNVHNLIGGIDAWSVEIDASVARYG